MELEVKSQRQLRVRVITMMAGPFQVCQPAHFAGRASGLKWVTPYPVRAPEGSGIQPAPAAEARPGVAALAGTAAADRAAGPTVVTHTCGHAD